MSTKKKKQAYEEVEEMMGKKLSLGLVLKSIRQCEEMTQKEFAKILDVSTQYLCDIEKGRRFVSPKVAAEFARRLGELEKGFVSLCLQDLLDREGLDLVISVEAA